MSDPAPPHPITVMRYTFAHRGDKDRIGLTLLQNGVSAAPAQDFLPASPSRAFETGLPLCRDLTPLPH
jgi:hypothetical protein